VGKVGASSEEVPSLDGAVLAAGIGRTGVVALVSGAGAVPVLDNSDRDGGCRGACPVSADDVASGVVLAAGIERAGVGVLVSGVGAVPVLDSSDRDGGRRGACPVSADDVASGVVLGVGMGGVGVGALGTSSSTLITWTSGVLSFIFAFFRLRSSFL
jgi:hypothetical protein